MIFLQQFFQQTFDKIIEVNTYELPLFTANIVVPEFIAITDGTFPVRVVVDYTFGRTMHGVALVSFKRFSTQVIFEKTINIGSSTGIFEVSIAKDLGITSEEDVNIELEFTDIMSDKKISASAITMIRNISTVLSLDFARTFKRNQIMPLTIVAIRYDGTPVSGIIFLIFICLKIFFFKAPANTNITVDFLLQEDCRQNGEATEWICPETTLTRYYATNDMGIARGDINTANYVNIIMEAHCASCESSDHLAVLHEPVFEIKILTEK